MGRYGGSTVTTSAIEPSEFLTLTIQGTAKIKNDEAREGKRRPQPVRHIWVSAERLRPAEFR
jgi:hypothetical protein